MKYDFDAAIFDMDGTLLNSMLYWRFTSLEFLLAHQLPVREEDLAKMMDTSSRRFLFEYAEREGIDIGTRAEVVKELEAFMNRHYLADTCAKPGIPELLQSLKEQGVRMCVATASPCEYGRNGLERIGLADYFEFITDVYEMECLKGEPEFFHRVAARLGTTADRCVVFEDALYAMKAAKEAGCTVMAVEDRTALLQREEIKRVADVYAVDPTGWL